MPRRRLHRLITALLVVASLLFSQLALAAYACPGESGGASMAERMAAGQPCDGMDTQQPALCHAHASAPAKAFEAVKLPVAGLPALLQVVELPLRLADDEAPPVPLAPWSGTRPPPDPLFLSTLRLRV